VSEITRVLKALRIALGILVKEFTKILAPFLIRLLGGIAVVVAIIYAFILWKDPDLFKREIEIKFHSYTEKLNRIIPELRESEPFEPKTKIPLGNFVVWYFGEAAEYFSYTHVRPLSQKEAGYERHVGFAGVEYQAYKFNWRFPNMYLQRFYTEDFYVERAGFVGELPWPEPQAFLLVKPVPSGETERIYSVSGTGGNQKGGQITLKRFGYKVWLYDPRDSKILGFQSFAPDPWPEDVSFSTRTRRGSSPMKDRSGNLITEGNRNYIGSNQKLFAWIRSIFELRDQSVYATDNDIYPKKP
jgi:hypothetical protein